MKIAIIINKARLTAELENQLKDGAWMQKYHDNFDVFIPEPRDIQALFQDLGSKRYDIYVVGGGDGTVRTAAKHLMHQAAALAILPLGTFNLLARSLGYPNDLESLLAMVVNRKTKQIDLATVNEHIVINHVWIGFYYHLLKARKKHRFLLGTHKLLKLMFHMLKLLRPLPCYQLTLKVDNQIQTFKTSLIFIGNNEAYTNLLSLGEHKTLTTGLLSVNILNCKNRWQFFWCFFTAIVNSLKSCRYVTQFMTDNLSIAAGTERIKVVIDGDLFDLKVPLEFSIHQKSLTVIIP